mgnify:CR=1 FL=1
MHASGQNVIKRYKTSKNISKQLLQKEFINKKQNKIKNINQ